MELRQRKIKEAACKYVSANIAKLCQADSAIVDDDGYLMSLTYDGDICVQLSHGEQDLYFAYELTIVTWFNYDKIELPLRYRAVAEKIYERRMSCLLYFHFENPCYAMCEDPEMYLVKEILTETENYSIFGSDIFRRCYGPPK